eukprot:1401_1
MGNYCTHPIQYKCLQFKVNLDIIDDPELKQTIDNILNCKEYESIYEPIYERYESVFHISNPIQYRWVPIQSQSYILIYFYYQFCSNINIESIECCFNKRFRHLVHPTFTEVNISCPVNIPITQLCMKCHVRKCETFRYGLKPDAVHISVTHHYCTDCKRINNTHSDDIRTQVEIKSDDAIVHNINININTSTHNQHIYTQPKYDGDKVSFQFHLFTYQAIMKHINPSLKIRDFEVTSVMDEIEALHRKNSMVFIDKWKYKKGFINCRCNQLIRDHKDRILALEKNERVNDQIHHFNFNDDQIVMNKIISLIDAGKVSPDEWIKCIPELKTSFFDANDIMMKLVQNEYPCTKKLNTRKFFKNLKLDDTNWNRAINNVQKRDCSSRYCRKNSNRFANTSEKILSKLLDENGYYNRYRTERQLQQNRYYDNNDGTPDVLFNLGTPLILKINGETKTIYWIDFKNWCFWVTSNMRYHTWKQNNRYLFMGNKKLKKVWPGMFVFRLGYVENISIGNDAVIVSWLWLQNNIPNIKKTSIKARISKNLIIRPQIEEFKCDKNYKYPWTNKDWSCRNEQCGINYYNSKQKQNRKWYRCKSCKIICEEYKRNNIYVYRRRIRCCNKRCGINYYNQEQKQNDKWYRCKRCKADYCSPKCHKYDWNKLDHKSVCNEYYHVPEIKENDEWLFEEEDKYYNDYTKFLPGAYRDEYGEMYPLYAKRG